MKLSVERTTWVLLAVAAAVVTWAHVDAQRTERPSATLVSSRSAAWRVLPELAGLAPTGSTVELWPAAGDPVVLRPGPAGHQVWRGQQILGPADPEAVDGIWDSLRMATTVRAVDDTVDVGLGDGGRIVVTLAGGQIRTVMLGRPAPDDAGRYGAIEGGAQGTEGLWVLEQELHVLVEQAPEAWLARRAVVAQAADVAAVREGSRVVARGIDGLWRGQVGSGPQALLDGMAVQTRLDRLLSARLEPLVDPRDGDEGQPWITLEGFDGVDWILRRHGPCPGRPTRVLVSRGPGRWGCLDGALVEPWPVPGEEAAAGPSLLDPHLAPHQYPRVLQILQTVPEDRRLSRHGGGWRIEQPQGERTAIYDVDESEVFRWYQALRDAEVSLAADPAWTDPPDVALTLSTDSTATLRLRCLDGTPLRCRRDDGPVLEVRGRAPTLAFDADTFAQRRLAALATEDVRAIEILPGDEAGPVVRQSAHFDLGVWRLDAPAHPHKDAALDEQRLSGLLGTLAALRAKAWTEAPPPGPPLRTLRVERVPRRDQDPVLVVELYEGCVVSVSGHRPALLDEGPCTALSQDLLVDHPLWRAVDLARSLELTQDGVTTRLRRSDETWVRDDGTPAPEAARWVAESRERTASGIEAGGGPGVPAWSLRVLPERGTASTFEGGPGWVRIEGQRWWYVLDGVDG
ncbi:MAG: DUF4340 domain-containing protein [Deltaproteobacteria bacterium]|nr:DUF4340 domain-containing protein [Deltaproteobacteria bacterium]